MVGVVSNNQRQGPRLVLVHQCFGCVHERDAKQDEHDHWHSYCHHPDAKIDGHAPPTDNGFAPYWCPFVKNGPDADKIASVVHAAVSLVEAEAKLEADGSDACMFAGNALRSAVKALGGAVKLEDG